MCRERAVVVPPRVEYSLAPFGRQLSPILAEMAEWGDAYMRRYEAKRAKTKRKATA